MADEVLRGWFASQTHLLPRSGSLSGCSKLSLLSVPWTHHVLSLDSTSVLSPHSSAVRPVNSYSLLISAPLLLLQKALCLRSGPPLVPS